MQRLVEGVRRFQTEVFPKEKMLFESLRARQQPVALFIGCSDSRMVPELITQAGPGDLFVIRNAGNLVPTYGEMTGGVSATIEYAMAILKVRHIIVCGHSDCGAMHAASDPKRLENLPNVADWLRYAEAAKRTAEEHHPGLTGDARLRALTLENVLSQLDHLRTHPAVASALARDEVHLHGWFYDIPNGKVKAYDPEVSAFVDFADRVSSPIARQRPKIALLEAV